MDELLPSAWLTGMDDPLRWMQAVAARLCVRPPCAPAQWLPPRARLAALRWYEPLRHELVTIFLFEKPGQIELGVWTTAWNDDQVGYWMYHELVITMATLIIDQYADQDGPPIQPGAGAVLYRDAGAAQGAGMSYQFTMQVAAYGGSMRYAAARSRRSYG